MVSHTRVVENYFNAGDREHYNHGASVFFEGDTLYSYGYHFVLATTCKNGYILNGDTYSVSTGKHQSIVRQNAPSNSPIVPFSALTSLFLNRNKKAFCQKAEVNKIEILDIAKDTYTTVTRKDREGNDYEAQVHHLGASLFKYKNKHYISSIDDGGKGYGQFFICEIPNKPLTVKDAFRQMANNLNDDEYQQYLEGNIKRQGEYFLIPTLLLLKDTTMPTKNMKHKVDLSRGRGNAHIARDYINIFNDIYIRGTLRHRQHKMVSMGNVWHRVIKNTAKQSWSASGDVD